jgi:hypothetical protein
MAEFELHGAVEKQSCQVFAKPTEQGAPGTHETNGLEFKVAPIGGCGRGGCWDVGAYRPRKEPEIKVAPAGPGTATNGNGRG